MYMDSCGLYLFLLALLFLQTLSVAGSRTKHYKWEVNYQFWSPDCVERVLIAINGQYPGPTIRAKSGDTTTEGVVIHWHGIRQIGTPWADGTASISQCAINPEETFIYKFIVDRSLLIEGRGQYNCSLMAAESSSACNMKNPQCAPFVLPVEAGKSYRLRIASVAALSSLNFLIEGHKIMIVEADGNYVEPVVVNNIDIYSGETYSVIIKADQDPSRNYWAAVNVRGRQPKTPTGLAVLNYHPNPPSKAPSALPPVSPPWNDFSYSKAFSKKIVSRRGFGPSVPSKSGRTIVLLNTQNLVDGYTKWAINNVSLVLPATPYLESLKYGLKKTFDPEPARESYAANYDIMKPPSNPNAVMGNGVYSLALNSTVDVILQNANTLTVNTSEIHPWHLHGHDFWVVGYGDGEFDAEKDVPKFNLQNPPLRNTVPLFPYGWTAIRFIADNPGVWAFHCHIEPHLHMGMGVVFAEAVHKVGKVPRSAMGCGGTKRWLP